MYKIDFTDKMTWYTDNYMEAATNRQIYDKAPTHTLYKYYEQIGICT